MESWAEVGHIGGRLRGIFPGSFATLRMTGLGRVRGGWRRWNGRNGLGGGCGSRLKGFGGWFGVGSGRGFGRLGMEVVVVGGDGVAEGFLPTVGAKSVDVFALGEVDGLKLGLEHVSDGASEARFELAANDGGDEAAESRAEVAGREVVAGEQIGDFAGQFFAGLDLGFFLSVIKAEVRMAA